MPLKWLIKPIVRLTIISFGCFWWWFQLIRACRQGNVSQNQSTSINKPCSLRRVLWCRIMRSLTQPIKLVKLRCFQPPHSTNFQTESNMNFSENIDTRRINRALATLRQRVEEVLKDAPNLKKINNLNQLGEKASVVEDHLWFIFTYGEYYVKKVIPNANMLELPAEAKKLFNYYKNNYRLSLKSTIVKLLDVSLAPTRTDVEFKISELEMNNSQIIAPIHIDINTYERYVKSGWLQDYIKGEIEIRNRERDSHSDSDIKFERSTLSDPYLRNSHNSGPIKNVFHTAMHAIAVLQQCLADSAPIVDSIKKAWVADGYDDDDFNDDDLELFHFERFLDSELATDSACKKIIDMPYFNPDDWAANEETLSPVIVTYNMEKIPKPITDRIREIYYSFIFSNWMSAIALSRCLLEYALIHRKSYLEECLKEKIEVRNDAGKVQDWEKDPIRLSKRARIAGKAIPQLKNSMTEVIERGNLVMHPFSTIPHKKDDAKRCVNEISKIISTLYSTESKQPNIKSSAK